MTATKKVRTVSEVNRYINGLMKDDFILKRISVKGEVSNLNKYDKSPAGHVYFSLKDEDGGSEISCAMWRSKRASGLKFALEDGQQVVVTGRIEVYEVGGRYQLYADEIKQDGEGERFLKLEALKNELAEMGMFDEQYKRPIPVYAHIIGVVTSPTGAAIRDIIQVAHRRNPFVRIILSPARVQGDGASEEIADALLRLDNAGCDVIILGRGGGSAEDLWAFNERVIADAIFACNTPVISAVGHEINWTIADLVADMRVPTPSAAAEIAVYEAADIENALREYYYRLNDAMAERIEDLRGEANGCRRQLALLSPMAKLNSKRDRLASLERRLILAHPAARIDMARKEMIRQMNSLNTAMNLRLSDAMHRRDVLFTRLEGVSPANKLKSGFSYVADAGGNRISTASKVNIGDDIMIWLHHGRIDARVVGVDEDYMYGEEDE